MKTMAKRTLSLLLAALMVLSLFPAMPHAHAEGEAEPVTYGPDWTYAVTKPADPEAGTEEENYSWLQGKFNTAESDYIYEGSYDWTVTMSPTKLAASGVAVEATIEAEDKTEIAKVTKTIDIAKAPSITTLVSHAEFDEQMAGKTGNFMLTVTVIYGGGPIAQLKAVFGVEAIPGTDGGDSGEGGESGSETIVLGQEWEFAKSVSFLKTEPNYFKFKTEDADLVYEAGQAYDWTVAIWQGKISPSVTLDVNATLYDENNSVVGTVSGKTVTAPKSNEAVLLSPADFAGLSNSKIGTFKLVCTVNYSGSPVIQGTVVFMRTGAADGGESGEGGEGGDYVAPEVGTVEWKYLDTYEWISGAFRVASHPEEAASGEALVYAGRDYNWYVTIAPGKSSGTADITATVVNEKGETVSTCSKSNVEFAKGPANTTIISYEDFPELTNELLGTFTLTCVVSMGGKNYAQVKATFSREKGCEHEWDEGEETLAASCEAAGEITYTCGLCQATKTEVVEALGHKMEVTEAKVPAGCESAGKEAVLICANGCGKSEGGEEIPATGHDWEVLTEGWAATCVSAGWADWEYCLNCEEMRGDEEIPALGHDMKETAAQVDPGCENPGTEAVYTCSRGCGKTEGGDKIDALGHEAGEEATCTEDQTCIRCDYVYNEATGHDLVNGACTACDYAPGVDITVNVTEEELCGGTITVTVSTNKVENCINGGFLFAFDTDVFEYVSGSSLITLSGNKAAGIDVTDGKVAGYFMSDVTNNIEGDIFTITLKVKADAPAGTYTITGTPNMTVEVDDGVDELYCVVSTDDVTVTGEHVMQEIATKVEPGCESVGKEAVLECTNCGHTKGGEEIPAVGHNLVNGACTACDYAPGVDFTVAVSDEELCGGTITVTVSITEIKGWLYGGFRFEFDKDVFEYVTGTVLVDGLSFAGVSDAADQVAGYIGSVEQDGGITCDIPAGEIFQITLKVKEGVTAGDYTITGYPHLVVINDGEQELTCNAGSATVVVTAHNMQQTAAAVAPGCETTGKEAVYTCANGCGHTTGGETIGATGHDMKQTADQINPGCESTGKTAVYTCANGCGHTEGGAVIPSLGGHTMVEVAPAVPSTCTTPGKKAVLACSRGCGYSYGGEENAKLNHSMQLTSAKVEPGCGKPGKEAVYTCSRGCGHTEGGAVIPALNHDMKLTAAKVNATCTTNGKEAVYTCSRGCGYTTGGAVINKTGHNYIDGTCSCGAVDPDYQKPTEPAPEQPTEPAPEQPTEPAPEQPTEPAPCEHTNVEVIPGKAATCTATGLTEGKKCATCGTVTVKQEVIAAKGHKEVAIPGKDATCTATGLTEGKKCATCGTVTVKQEVIAAKGHKEVVIPGKDATCTATGLTAGKKCSTCGTVTVKQEVIPAKGHKEVAIPGKDATCTATGLTAGKKCSTCGTVTVKQEVIPAKGHNMKETAAAVAATCTEPGKTAVLTCANGCGYTTGGEVVPATGHNHVDGACACGDTIYVVGDINGTEEVTQEDVVYLLLHVLYGQEDYPVESIPVEAPADIDKNGEVDEGDVVYLLLHTMFTEMFYPLKSK